MHDRIDWASLRESIAAACQQPATALAVDISQLPSIPDLEDFKKKIVEASLHSLFAVPCRLVAAPEPSGGFALSVTGPGPQTVCLDAGATVSNLAPAERELLSTWLGIGDAEADARRNAMFGLAQETELGTAVEELKAYSHDHFSFAPHLELAIAPVPRAFGSHHRLDIKSP